MGLKAVFDPLKQNQNVPSHQNAASPLDAKPNALNEQS
jgi:hypothetical protein